ncbi:MAG: dTDP-4-dehydrorhamnose reductase [Bacteroidales bacterium]|jgi:dTDP-4-dehydrorhamnose reductase|nr:dTDP-4-dehydrorhamnose reductase [Bacteroidales bacterium]
MKVLITGSNGQLGNELRSCSAGSNFLFEDVDTLDITNHAQVEKYFIDNSVEAVINGAAYTAVDKAESDVGMAFKVNRDGVAVLSDICKKHNAFMLHVSTDYVFDGTASEPYKEDAVTNPQSVYGVSKLAGENAMIISGVNGAIVRTSWLYSSFGNNFVKTMLRLAGERDELRVVNDQYGSPTYAADLAAVLLKLLTVAHSGLQIYNYANNGVCSWHEFASEIIRQKGLGCKVIPVPTAEYPTAAVRPRYSVLDTSKIATKLNIKIPAWQHSLEQMLSN